MSDEERPEESQEPESEATPEQTASSGGALDDEFLNDLMAVTGEDGESAPVSLDGLDDETELDGQRENDDLIQRDADLTPSTTEKILPDAPTPTPTETGSLDASPSEEESVLEEPKDKPAAAPSPDEDQPAADYDVDALFAQSTSATEDETPDNDVLAETTTEQASAGDAESDVTEENTEDTSSLGSSSSESKESSDEVIPLDAAELDALAAELESEPETADTKNTSATAEATTATNESDGERLSDDEIAAMVGTESSDGKTSGTDDAGLSQEDLDALLEEAQAEGVLTREKPEDEPAEESLEASLADAGEEQLLDGKDPEAPLVDTTTDTGVSLEQDNVAAILGDELPEAEPAETADTPANPDESTSGTPVSDDLIDALVSAASAPDPAAEVGSENLAAAASEHPTKNKKPDGDEMISQDDLDALIEAAKVQDQTSSGSDGTGSSTARPTGAAGSASGNSGMDDAPSRGTAHQGSGTGFSVPRTMLSIAAGLIIGIGVFVALQLNREIRPSVPDLLAGTADELQLALRIARGYVDEGSYGLALQELEGPMSRAKEGADRTAGEFLRLEARIQSYLEAPDPRLLDELFGELDRLLEAHADHARRPDALYWKAQLFLSDDLPIAAQDLYDDILKDHPGLAQEDTLLFEAAKLAMRLHQPTKAAARIQQLINEYPGSQYATESRLLLGDAYAEAGLPEDARTLYMRSVQRAPTARDRAAAILRLGKLAYDEERYAQAITDLDNYLSLTTTTEGSDAAYLLLAQAYRADGQLDAARDTLNDLIRFLDESPVTPEAFVELSQVLDALGQRDEAIRLAKEAAVRYPENPRVLRNAGVLHGLDGNPFAAAGALLAAETFGANEPRLLLTAARHLRTAGLDDDARNTYVQLQQTYPGLPEAIVAGAEEARILFEQGEIETALDKLDELTITSVGGSEYMTVLKTQASLLESVGMFPELTETAREIARVSQDDQDLGMAASALLTAGELEEAQNIIARTQLARLRDTDAHALLVQLGEAYLKIDPRRAIDTLEEAYRAYPGARTPDSDNQLLKAYIAANRAAAARRMVFEIAAHVEENPIDAPHLIDATINYGDYLFERRDYRAAADAYAQALEAAIPETGNTIVGRERAPDWAKFQRANALLELADFEGSIALYAEISASEAPWAADAAAKAEYARLEQQLRGITPATQQS